MPVQIIIKEVTEEVIRLEIDGEMREIRRNPEDLLNLLKQQQQPVNYVQTADKIINIDRLNHATLNFFLGQADRNQALPAALAGDLSTDTTWFVNLGQELLKGGASVNSDYSDLSQHFGWLIGVFLNKLRTKPGMKPTLRRLSFMAEAYHSSLRYLCYIQLSTFLKYVSPDEKLDITDFVGMNAADEARFDYLDLLMRLTDQLPVPGRAFMPKLGSLVTKIYKDEDSVRSTVFFLANYRKALLRGEVVEDHAFGKLLDEYLTALVHWLCELTFLANYRLVSIKNIFINYRLGSGKSFEHHYGQLHGFFEEKREEIKIQRISNKFTYNHSVLLFNGNDLESCLKDIHKSNSYISLSPLLIDQSVFAVTPTQTPEIYYYSGLGNGSARNYLFAHYPNELAYEGKPIASNKEMEVKRKNTQAPLLDDLYLQLDAIFKPLR